MDGRRGILTSQSHAVKGLNSVSSGRPVSTSSSVDGISSVLGPTLASNGTGSLSSGLSSTSSSSLTLIALMVEDEMLSSGQSSTL